MWISVDRCRGLGSNFFLDGLRCLQCAPWRSFATVVGSPSVERYRTVRARNRTNIIARPKSRLSTNRIRTPGGTPRVDNTGTGGYEKWTSRDARVCVCVCENSPRREFRVNKSYCGKWRDGEGEKNNTHLLWSARAEGDGERFFTVGGYKVSAVINRRREIITVRTFPPRPPHRINKSFSAPRLTPIRERDRCLRD